MAKIQVVCELFIDDGRNLRYRDIKPVQDAIKSAVRETFPDDRIGGLWVHQGTIDEDGHPKYTTKALKEKAKKTLKLRKPVQKGLPPITKKDRSRAGAVARAKLLKKAGISLDEWDPLAVLGCFHLCYKDWCLADYQHGSFQLNLALIEELVAREGSRRALSGIKELFYGKQLAWVNRKELEFLTDSIKWSRFVAPALASKKVGSGEQSEYRGESNFGVRRKK